MYLDHPWFLPKPVTVDKDQGIGVPPLLSVGMSPVFSFRRASINSVSPTGFCGMQNHNASLILFAKKRTKTAAVRKPGVVKITEGRRFQPSSQAITGVP